MMTKNINPWLDVSIGSQRRIDSTSVHDLYRIKDGNGNYGFYIKFKEEFADTRIYFRLRGIEVYKNNNDNQGNYTLLLNEKKDWHLFYILSNDLINICSSISNEGRLITELENRLKRWQRFLMKNKAVELSTELQMGLFSELYYLQNYIIPNYGIKDSISAWGGPNKERNDFNTVDSIIELKTYKSNNAAIISISSVYQLFSEDKPVKLVALALTESDLGDSVLDLYRQIRALISNESIELLEEFEEKVINYGLMIYIDNQNLKKFVVDNMRNFAVENDFPLIKPMDIASEILSVNYSIDLELCKRFELDNL
ncbi:PD-(D/E)XK motif protein [Myroides injenensis]|uniref:PD-(D/E)XK motif protein n=1 Tax=Myroides injenensis TaxID=1183151 RepID=UPI0002887FF5|nr:PD-(D/E)XK motif protein [Myroides injenensis]